MTFLKNMLHELKEKFLDWKFWIEAKLANPYEHNPSRRNRYTIGDVHVEPPEYDEMHYDEKIQTYPANVAWKNNTSPFVKKTFPKKNLRGK